MRKITVQQQTVLFSLILSLAMLLTSRKENHWTSMSLNIQLDQGQHAQRLPGLKGIQILNNSTFLPNYTPQPQR